MSQKDGFAGGFILGSILGGVIGGVIGTIAASRTNARSQLEDASALRADANDRLNSQENIEFARRSLEDKISQLNLAIDDVRGKLNANETNSLKKEEDLAH
jgi:predicted  nucleic acid-binding Zn-ribbon protein